MLPTIKIGELEVSRLIIGGNPFSGFSHQSGEMDREMRDYYTVARIKETLATAEAHGINTFVGRADAHIMRLLTEYWNEGGRIQWIAQTAPEHRSDQDNIRRAVHTGASACYIHGGPVDQAHREGRLEAIGELIAFIQAQGVPAGMAAHNPQAHLRAHELGLGADFHTVCFYDCGTVHAGEGDRFRPADREAAVAAIQQLPKPCLGYKILAAGRNDPAEAFRYAFTHLKPTDAVVVGMFTKYQPTQVEENVALVERILADEHPPRPLLQKGGGGSAWGREWEKEEWKSNEKSSRDDIGWAVGDRDRGLGQPGEVVGPAAAEGRPGSGGGRLASGCRPGAARDNDFVGAGRV